MQMENNSMGGLSPEARQRLKDSLQAFEARERLEGMNQGYSSQFTNASRASTNYNQAWAHWEYDHDEWALFNKIDWETARTRSLLGLILGPIVCLGLIAALLGIGMVAFHSSDDYFNIVYILSIFLLMGLGSLLVSSASLGRKAKKRYLARQNPSEPQRVTFAKEGIWEAGAFFPLKSSVVKLKRVKLTSQPSVLHFKVFEAWQATYRGTTNGTRQWIRVLVPRGYEADAEQLRQRYYAELINAKPQTYTPSEPI